VADRLSWQPCSQSAEMHGELGIRKECCWCLRLGQGLTVTCSERFLNLLLCLLQYRWCNGVDLFAATY